MLGFLLALCAGLLATCAPRGGLGPPAPPPGKLQRLQWASIDFNRSVPGDEVVELRVIVANLESRATNSTSILWEPAFAAQFTFLRSDPAPWRVRIDEQGWGVLDTAGILPAQFGTFRVWFVAPQAGVVEPRVRVVIDGRLELGPVVAGSTQAVQIAAQDSQQVFERGRLAAVAERAGILPDGPRGAFASAAGIGLILVILAGSGGAAALRLTIRAPPPP